MDTIITRTCKHHSCLTPGLGCVSCNITYITWTSRKTDCDIKMRKYQQGSVELCYNRRWSAWNCPWEFMQHPIYFVDRVALKKLMRKVVFTWHKDYLRKFVWERSNSANHRSQPRQPPRTKSKEKTTGYKTAHDWKDWTLPKKREKRPDGCWQRKFWPDQNKIN